MKKFEPFDRTDTVDADILARFNFIFELKDDCEKS